MQPLLPFSDVSRREWTPLKSQLLKWIGNKQRFAHRIVSFFPRDFGTYYEPFLGSGAVLATLAPRAAVGSDVFEPLIQIWQTLQRDPEQLKAWYAERWHRANRSQRQAVYEEVKASFNAHPNGPDLLYLCRSCYGGVVRFRKSDGHMSTPCGIHQPIAPASFAKRVDLWRRRCANADFVSADYAEMMDRAKAGDLVYCDPPYVDSQAIIYGAQGFSIATLFDVIARCKSRGVRVVLSIDGTKRSGNKICDVRIPDGLFEAEAVINCGRSMLRRFQMAGQTLEKEVVADRLLFTYAVPED
ncbi:MAG TPA: Dam family site-specific DNA-(adenine-N6)-methyltransferase [Pirellulales bacterium]